MPHTLSTPFWLRRRGYSREDQLFARSAGFRLPLLKQISLVELDAIHVPGWARAKAVRGLTITASSVWLRRQAANLLVKLDREAGGSPKITLEFYRRCNVCDRALLGPEAEARFELDRKFFGQRITCGPDCAELEKARKRR